MSTEVANPNHKDWFSKISLSLLTVACIGIMSTGYGVLRAQVVLASDLEPIQAEIADLKVEVATIKEDNQKTHSMIRLQTVLYYEDQIRILEVKAVREDLNPEETQRLLRYRADLDKIQR